MMVMGSQHHLECLQVLHHASKATINYCGQCGEEETRERGDLGGKNPSPLNQFQIIFLPIPEQKKHWKLFFMHLGSKAAL